MVNIIIITDVNYSSRFATSRSTKSRHWISSSSMFHYGELPELGRGHVNDGLHLKRNRVGPSKNLTSSNFYNSFMLFLYLLAYVFARLP